LSSTLHQEIVRTLTVSRATVRKVIRSHKAEFKYARGERPMPLREKRKPSDALAIISYHEKPGIQAIATTAPNLPPEPGIDTPSPPAQGEQLSSSYFNIRRSNAERVSWPHRLMTTTRFDRWRPPYRTMQERAAKGVEGCDTGLRPAAQPAGASSRLSSSTASAPDIIRPICVGGTDAISLALSS
jgi:hypothetical protein